MVRTIAGSGLVKSSRQSFLRSSALGLVIGGSAFTALPPDAVAEGAPLSPLPVDGVVTSGSAAISSPSDTGLLITQSSQNAIIDWSSFSIANGYSVRFDQPDSQSATLNRVSGDTPSTIAGSLSANGRVLLVNPNGIAITQTGTVDAGAFVASTLDIADADFLSGRLTFRQGGSRGVVTNAGRVTASEAVAFLGSGVVNEGVVAARLGKVGYGAGDLITVDFTGDDFLSVALPVQSLEGLTDAAGRPLSALISAGGTTQADGGQIVLSAQAAEQIILAAVQVPGELIARTIEQGPGNAIRLAGSVNIEGAAGNVDLTGRIDVSGGATAEGGTAALSTAGVAFLTGAIDASGSAGGAVSVDARNLLSAGSIHTGGLAGNGGSIRLDASGQLVATSASALNADGASGGSIRLTGGETLYSSGTATAIGSAGQGGGIRATGGEIRLIAADFNASGETGGGTISLGFDGARNAPDIVSRLIDVSPHTVLRVDATGAGHGGVIGMWSRETTTSFATLSARGGAAGGNGGFIEVSSEGLVTAGGDVSAAAPGGGNAGTFLLDPRTIIIDDVTGVYPQYQLVSPTSSVGDRFGQYTTVLSNGNVAVTAARDDFGATDAGAVFLFNGETGELISSLTGSTTNDYIGSQAISALSNGNFYIRNPNWDNGATTDASAVTWVNGVTGLSGAISATNSLVGTASNDAVGSNGIVELGNGNFVVLSPNWDNGPISNVGAVTWGNGTTGVAGIISAANSLVGSTNNDYVGNSGIKVLTNSNYVIKSANWDNGAATNAGAVTWGNGTTGVSGTISATNSLVGSTTSDQVGNNDVTALSNGNYVVSSSLWDNGSATDAGAVTWGSGTTGVSGAVSAANSLVGSTSTDYVGTGGVTALSSGNYVVTSAYWNNGAATDAGAVTWGNGTTGVSGAVSAANSLVGTTSNDNVGSNGVTVLNNGNYVVRSMNWNNGSAADAGAVTWGSGTSGVSGAVSATNSLVGSTLNDYLGNYGITVLSNGNYVVSSASWDNGSVSDAGAVTWGSGTSGVSGAVSAANSLVGSTNGDFVGSSSITALNNGNYVVRSNAWDNGSAANAGAVTWGSGTSGVSGVVSAANSLVGSTSQDNIGNYGITALSNGNYIVNSAIWDNGSVSNAGAVTWGSGTSGVSGVVSAANSLVGSSSNDTVGASGVTALSNGNYVVSSSSWDHGSVSDAGAVTWGSGTSGISGAVSATNSLVGSTSGDTVGNYGITALSNGNYVVRSAIWDNGNVANVGAVTWGSGTSGISGAVSAANSLIGSSSNDTVGSSSVTALSNGNYVVGSTSWDNGGVANAGAVTWGSGTSGVSGTISAANSLVGSSLNDYVGNSGVLALGNGDYIVRSTSWDNGVAIDAGAATWASGTSGISGAISAANSLIGSSSYDNVGQTVQLTDSSIILATAAASSSVSNGRVLAGLTGPNQLTFSRASGQDMTIRSDFLTRTLDAGTDVMLEATTDIFVNSAITANNPSGNGGALSLFAGRSILVNSNITTDNGNLTLFANTGGSQPGLVSANRQAGAAEITMAAGTVIDAGTGTVTLRMGDGSDITGGTSGAITLGTINAGRIDARNLGTDAGSDIIVRSTGALTASGTGRAIDLAALGGEVTNLAGDAGLNLSGGGHYGIFAATPTGSQIGTPSSYLRRYSVANATAYDALNPGGNFAAFRFAPILTITPDDASRIYGDTNPAFTFDLAGFLTGDSASDVTGLPSLSTTANALSGIGTYDILSALGTLASAQGYQFSLGTGGLTIAPRPITVTADDLSQSVGAADPELTYTVAPNGLVNGDTFLGTLSRDQGETAGNYAIRQGSLSAGANYQLAFVEGVLTLVASQSPPPPAPPPAPQPPSPPSQDAEVNQPSLMVINAQNTPGAEGTPIMNRTAELGAVDGAETAKEEEPEREPAN